MAINKNGFYFSLDAFLALAVIVTGVLLIPHLYTQYTESTTITYVSKDLTELMATTKISDVNNAYIQSLIISGDVENPDLTIAEQITRFWIEGKQAEAKNIITNITQGMVPENVDFSIVIGNETVYTKGTTPTKTLITTNQMITGMKTGQALEGSAVRIFLTGLSAKTTSKFIYFGGFVGQGKISRFMDDLPNDATIVNMEMELDAAAGFDLLINNQSCGSFSPSGGIMTADTWNITDCKNLIESGSRNNFTIDFGSSDVSASYIGGGYIKIRYRTNNTDESEEYGKNKYYFPEIEGLVNLYSGMSVPGTLEEMKLKLHLTANQSILNRTTPFYLLIGNKIVYQNNDAFINETLIIPTANLSKILNYASLSNTTIPIRIGMENLTYELEYIGVADVSLITDLSGSMDWRMDQDSVNGVLRNCDNSQLGDSDTQRLSVAKCLDNQFIELILNTSGNEIGLIAFESSTRDSLTVAPTTNVTLLNETIGTAVPLTGYAAGGGTCLCCGINSAIASLTSGITTTVYINSNENWEYNNFSLDGSPTIDANMNEWYELEYNDTAWHSGNAILGATNGLVYTPTVDTEMGSELTGEISYVNLWENVGDTSGMPVDFSSGTLNSSANTFGIGNGNDGWDWEAGTYGDNGNSVTMSGIANHGGDNELRIYIGATSTTSSGAYGIELTITNQMYNTISSNGHASLSFDYEWDGADNPFETSDQAWVKARITTPSSGPTYLGENLDSSHNNGDTDLEIYAVDNPDSDFTGSANLDLTSFITQAGTYYLDFGGKLTRSIGEDGYFYFDDLQIEISNKTDHYYLRKEFNIADINKIRRGMINVLSDDKVKVYLNGDLLIEEAQPHQGQYWNIRGRDIPGNKFNPGTNILAIELQNINGAAKFDLELKGFDDPKAKAMMVMTDGEATTTGTCPQAGTAKERAILAACEAKEEYGITVHSVGYSEASDETTLQAISECGSGLYSTSSNLTELEAFYEDVASAIIEVSKRSQQIITGATFSNSILYGDSYIEITYKPNYNKTNYAEVPITLQTGKFGTCKPQIDLPDDLRIIEAKILSYSSEHWTDFVEVNKHDSFKLADYNLDYTPLGDPFVVEVMPNYLFPGSINNITVLTGDNVTKKSNCSMDNSMIYTGMVSSSLTFDSIKELREGCEWTVETQAGSFITINSPTEYAGLNDCYFNSTNTSYNTADAYDTMMYKLLDRLDLDNDGKIDLELNEENLNIDTLLIENIPYLWGPTLFEVRTWH